MNKFIFFVEKMGGWNFSKEYTYLENILQSSVK